MTNQENKMFSIERRMLLLLTIALLFLISLLLTINFYTIYQSNEKIIGSNQRSMDYSLNQIERSLNEVDEMLTGLAASSPDFASLMSSPGELQAHLASHELVNRLQDLSRAYVAADAFFIYSHNSDTYRDSFATSYSYKEKQEIRAWLQEVVRINRFSHKDGWVTRNIGGSFYTLRFFGGRGTYLIALSSFETLGDIGFFTDEDISLGFQTLSGNTIPQAAVPEQLLPSADNAHYYNRDASLMVLQDQIPNTDLRLFLLIPNSGYWHGLSTLHWVLLLISLTSIGLLPLAWLWIRHNISRPLKQIQYTIQAIRAGEEEVRSPASRIQEFDEVSTTFNAMITQIHKLKIESYEHQIETQQAQLQYLQLQIRPHFYLNVLKGLYAVAEQEDTKRIQQMILAFSGHLRYIFRDQMELVSVREELDHIRNYIHIQRLFSANQPICHIDVDESLYHHQIPPLTLATFVENSIQHQGEDQIYIWIKAERMETEGLDLLMLSVEDNGKGFSDYILKEINRDSDGKIYTESHVGIRNIRQRFRLMYGSNAMLAFYNGQRGPVSELYLPIAKES